MINRQAACTDSTITKVHFLPPEKWESAGFWTAGTLTKYWEWHLRMLCMTGFDLQLWFPSGAESTMETLTQSDTDDMETLMVAMDTLMGGTDNQGVVLGPPLAWDRTIENLKIDVAGQFIHAVLVRPDKWQSENNTDLDSDADNQVHSTVYTLVANDVGKSINVTAGAGWNTGYFKITSVTAGVATLDANVGTHPIAAQGTWAMTNFGESGGNVEVAFDGAVQQTIPNATIDSETDPGALLVQTDLET